MAERIVIVGASLAGLRAGETLRHLGHQGPLTLIGAETHLPYDRPPLSKQVLVGKIGPEATALGIDPGLDADWRLGVTASGLDLERKRIQLEDGDDVEFDRLVIATGAHPRMLPDVPPRPGVHYLRTLDDAVALRQDLTSARRAVVIGAGFIGLEVAASASALGVEVTVLEMLAVPLERAVGQDMGRAIADLHLRRGIDLRLETGVTAVEGVDRPDAVRLSEGPLVEADVVVVGVGVSPNTAWLAQSGLDIDDGLVCDEKLRVLAGGRPRPDVVAAGDVVRWSHPDYGERVRVEHWTNAAEQGQAAAHSLLAGEEAPAYAPVPYFWSDQFGMKIQFVGRAHPDDEVTVIEGSPEEERFVAAYGRRGRLVAGLGLRRPARVMALQQMIAAGAPFPPPPFD